MFPFKFFYFDVGHNFDQENNYSIYRTSLFAKLLYNLKKKNERNRNSGSTEGKNNSDFELCF